MSNLNPEDDLIQDYLAECREHLADIESNLLAIEQAGCAIDEELVNRVFRAAHSIKGGAGFFGLATIRELAHKIENVLEMVRSRQLTPSSELISLLLHAFDRLRELLDNYSVSNGADIAEFVSSLTAASSSCLSGEEKKLVDEQVVIQQPASDQHLCVSAFDLTQARRGGKSIYLLRYDLIHDLQRRQKSPMDVLRNLIQFGIILETFFDLDSAGTLEDEPSNELILEILYATVIETDLIRQVVEIPSERIFVIGKDAQVISLEEKMAAKKPAVIAPPAPVASVTPVPPVVAAAPPASPKPEPKATPKPAAPATPAVAASPSEAPSVDVTVRLNVALLDSLMTLAGELVLSRNQLNEAFSRKDDRAARQGAQRISLVTSELQEVVTQTRMRPLGGLFSKFTRLVRDLAKGLGKEVQLKIEGSEVEIDKTILEGLGDPLTHMVRNSVDHGIELPEVRVAAGKPRVGTILLRASHQAGQVVIEISDDGKGLAVQKVADSAIAKGLITAERLQTLSDREKLALIFLPGVSTAEKVSDVSGRGVGMDVVKTNLDKLGGKIEIESTPGKGAQFRIKLPLTLAIIPSLLVSSRGERFAIPQVNVSELIRIPATQVATRTDQAGNAMVLILRDRLVPLVKLSASFGKTDSVQPDGALNVVLVDTGLFEYGLVVEQLHDTVEIVVKPLGRHVQGVRDYAGATILGDGHVALILDVAGLATRVGLSSSKCETLSHKTAEAVAAAGEQQSLLVFRNGPQEPCAVPIELVSRIERIRASQVERLGGRRTMQYRGASLPLLSLSDVAAVDQISDEQQLVVIVFEIAGRPLGLLAAEPVDMIEANLTMDSVTLRQRGVAGSALINGQTTLMIDIFELAGDALPERPQPQPSYSMDEPAVEHHETLLLAEDSDFFRGQIQRIMEAVGYHVVAVEDGQKAWEMLQRQPEQFSLVATDIEMPQLDGLSLTRRIRADERFSHLPVIALSSLSGEEEIARGVEAGVTEYHVKLDQDQLLESIQKVLKNSAHQPVPAI
jgi:two-component system, chemotaxis family, sensor kinase CheA